MSDNSASYGDGIYNTGTVTVTNSTFSGNSAYDGDGIYTSTFGTTNLRNTIIAGNTADNSTSASAPDAYGPVNSQGNNLFGDTSNTSGFISASDLLNQNPLLGPLQNNNGPTNTFALLPGSPAIDAATNTGCPVTGQRGLARKDGDGTVVCDI